MTVPRETSMNARRLSRSTLYVPFSQEQISYTQQFKKQARFLYATRKTCLFINENLFLRHRKELYFV